MIDVRIEMDVQEIEGRETTSMNARKPQLAIRSHSQKPELVVFEIDGKTHAVEYPDLAAAFRCVTARREVRP